MTPGFTLDFFLSKLDEDLNLLYENSPEIQSANKALGPWSLMLLEDVPIEEALASYVEGGGDKGLDCIYIPDAPGNIVLIQAKRLSDITRNFPKNEIVLSLNGVRWLLNGDLNDPTINPSFRAKAKEFRDEYTTNFPKVNIYFVGTGRGPAPNGISEITNFLGEANSSTEKIFTVTTVDIDNLKSRFCRSLQTTTPNEITLEFSKPNPYEHETGDLRAIVGSVSGKTLAMLFDEHGNAIFEANVRNYLGNISINRQIESTATDQQESSNFWFYNNGISMVCSQLSFRSQRDTSKVRLTNAQIVNGCQTVHSLWHAFKSGELQDDVELLVRIVEQPDPDFVPLVTRYNNTQNAVRMADLVGRHPIQMRLQTEFDRLGYYYETRRGDWRQYHTTRDERIERFGRDYVKKVITSNEAAQACAAFYLLHPVIAKNKTTILTTLGNEGGMYEDVFDDNISAPRILGAVSLLRRITDKRKEILRSGRPRSLAKYEDWLPHADFHILSLMSRQYFDAHMVRTNEEIGDFFTELNQRFENLYAGIVKRIGPFLQEREKEPGYSHPRFLKTETSWQEIVNVMGRRNPIRIY